VLKDIIYDVLSQYWKIYYQEGCYLQWNWNSL